MPAPLAVAAFALTWWLGAYLVGRDATSTTLWRAAGGLWTYGTGVVAWTVAPGSFAAQTLLCLPALFWAGVATALLPSDVPERTLVNRGWPIAALVFLVPTLLLPSVGKLVALAPLAGGLVLLLRYRHRVRPQQLPPALTIAAALYVAGLIVVLAPLTFGAPELVIATIGLDLLLCGFLVAAFDAVDTGERLLPDLRRSLVFAGAALLLCGGPAAITMLAVPGRATVTVLQFVLVGVVMSAVGLAVPVRAGLDRLAFLHDERLRRDRSALLLAAEALTRRRERHRMIGLDEAEFRRLVRRALDGFGDGGRMLRNPLAELPAVDRRLHARGAGLAEQPLARVAELRAVLVEQVERLKPGGPPDTSEEWRFYNALHYCCVLGLRPYDRAPQLDGLDRDARRILDWIRRYVRREALELWTTQAAEQVASRMWRDLLRTDPRWLTRSDGPVEATRGTNSR
ncbi:hypothetical protein [Actinoplanes sp. TFC3]|uniref:hypothetical protein n=1 Tax=Actinoplanes sp. TFC3 TaxID=1710355 RepID=UPI00082B28DC|nr:hypothetical protein [Actinoplanes sp. TFC3]